MAGKGQLPSPVIVPTRLAGSDYDIAEHEDEVYPMHRIFISRTGFSGVGRVPAPFERASGEVARPVMAQFGKPVGRFPG